MFRALVSRLYLSVTGDKHMTGKILLLELCWNKQNNYSFTVFTPSNSTSRHLKSEKRARKKQHVEIQYKKLWIVNFDFLFEYWCENGSTDHHCPSKWNEWMSSMWKIRSYCIAYLIPMLYTTMPADFPCYIQQFSWHKPFVMGTSSFNIFPILLHKFIEITLQNTEWKQTKDTQNRR